MIERERTLRPTGEIIERGASEGLIGRSGELEQLLAALHDDGPRVVFVHGIAGVGKSTLLEAFAGEARLRGAIVIALDCREVEPTERGVMQELASAVGGDAMDGKTALQRLPALGDRVVIVLDTYEVFRVLDTWLRRKFIPALGDNVRIVMAGRDAPVPAWSAPGWHGLFRGVALGPLATDEAERLLARLGLPHERARRVNRFARGHPLALTVAASAARERPDLDLEDVAIPRIFGELARVYLAELEPLTRRALDAASVVRRATVSLLRAMLPDVAPRDAFERLGALPFVEVARDGLVLHDTMQQAIAAGLSAADPEAYRGYRRAAWRQLRSEVRNAAPPELWRYTADMIYLIENPVVREAFFPTGAHLLSVEPALAEDGEGIHTIARVHETEEAVALLDAWWSRHPEHFRAVRDLDGELVGFYLMFERGSVDTDLLRRDPVTAAFAEHLRQDLMGKGQLVLFHRRRLSRAEGEEPGPVQAACYLDMKRVYMELRPRLRRVYTCRTHRVGRGSDALGFRPLDGPGIELGGSRYHATFLDFGPASVDGWLAWLAATELGVDEDDVLDPSARELIVDGERIALTPLEFGVMQHLVQRESKAVSRADLLESVWGYDYDGGSNVVDAVIRSLRKKLRDSAFLVETVRGVGYRFRKA